MDLFEYKVRQPGVKLSFVKGLSWEPEYAKGERQLYKVKMARKSSRRVSSNFDKTAILSFKDSFIFQQSQSAEPAKLISKNPPSRSVPA
jgi:hypothetical protein